MDTQNQGREARRVYQVPAMALVQLRPEEAVLAACKSGAVTGPGYTGCESMGVPCSTTTGS